MTFRRLLPTDIIVIGYSVGMALLLLIVGRPLPGYVDELAFYGLMAALPFAVARFVDPSRGRLMALVRYAYPVLLFTFFYKMTGGTIFLLHEGWFDGRITEFEKALFGVNPTMYIDRLLPAVWFTEAVMFCYFCYYFMIPGFTLYAFFRKDYEILKRGISAICLTFFVSYPLFFLYPVQGPRWHFAEEYTHAVEGPVFRELVNIVIENGAVRGGCVPSTHVAVALVILLFCFRHYRRLGWLLLPINIGLAIGTVWGRFHYVSDVVVGVAIAVACTVVVWKWYDRWDPVGRKQNSTSKVPVSHAA
ncbi:MAG: phosphatase PAP2 family protein [candidate division Zixibacteria bacterium]|nr:phosphatase PAP2 family protein [candidate division Zixibacteria bacterium]